MEAASIWNSKEFVAAIIGALLGGVLSIIASYISVYLQNSKQIRERQNIVRDFVVEHAAYFNDLAGKLIDHFDKKDEVWFEYVTEIKTAYDVVVRNIEHLVMLPDAEDRKLSRKYFSEIYFIANRCMFFQSQVYECLKSLNDLSVKSAEEHQRSLMDAKSNVKNSVADLKQANSFYYELERRLKNHSDG